mgnify:CR=1 FL=1
MQPAIINFAQINLDVTDKDVLEVGSLNINGGLREHMERYAKSWVGIDAVDGKDVDEVIKAE